MHPLLTDQARPVMLIVLCGLIWAVESIVPLYRFRYSRVNIFSFWDRLFGTYTSAVDFRTLNYGLDGFDVKERQTFGGLLKILFVH